MRNNIGSLEVLIISTYRFRALTFLEGISLNSLDAPSDEPRQGQSLHQCFSL